MNKGIMVIALMAIIFSGVIGFLFIQNQTNNTAQSKPSQEQSPSITDSEPQGELSEETTQSQYIQFSESAFQTVSTQRRVLFFYASWCSTCIPADKNITENASQIPDDLTVIRVNYNDPDTDDQEKELAKKYGITYQHTFVQIDQAGNEVTKWNGGQIKELLKNIQ